MATEGSNTCLEHVSMWGWAGAASWILPIFEKRVSIWVLFWIVRTSLSLPEMMAGWVPITDPETWTYQGVTWYLGKRDVRKLKAT